MNDVIDRVIKIVGSQSELAVQIGVNQSAISKWLGGGGIRTHYISAISAATGGQISELEILNSLSRRGEGGKTTQPHDGVIITNGKNNDTKINTGGFTAACI